MPSTQRLLELCLKSVFFGALLIPILMSQGCSGGYSSNQNPVTVSVAPTSATVALTKTQQFTATVSYATSTAVTWQVNGTAGGSAATGTIAASGLYTAPTAAPNPATVTITAISQADTTKSGSAVVTISALSDTTAPSAPAALAATAITSSEIDLSWNASTDNVGVTGYSIDRCTGNGCTSFSGFATTTGATTFKALGLLSGTTFGFRVKARDAAGNFSNASNISYATTSGGADTTNPTAPTALLATAISSSQINLAWTASTDNVGVTGYKVERCSGASCSGFAQIGTTTGAVTFSNTGLAASTSYSYRVRATDLAGNLSGYSNTSSATTSAGGSSITVSVSPRRGGLTVSQKLSVRATLTNDTTSAGVTWSSTGGGSFSPTTSTSGTAVTFTAPSSAGMVTITATSIADGTKFATSTVGITDLTAVATYLNGNARQGGNLQEHALATSGATAVNSTNFGKLFSCTVDAAVYAQPLWVANLSISGVAHNVVYVATQHNTVYALDADSSGCQNVWGGAKNLNPSGQTWVTSGNASCSDLQPDIGIVGTPVIDLTSKTLYVVTKSKTTSGATTYHQFLHALDLATGAEKFSGPTEISASVSGNGTGSSGGILTFDPLIQNERSALLLTNGHVIIAWASHCDVGAYHGWLMSYGASTLTQEAVLNLSPNGTLNGIWMSGNGPAADSSGNIYFATGNGTFDANSGSAPNNDYGDSIVKVGPPASNTFPVLSYFTPSNEASLEAGDIDQGSGGVALLPDVTAGSYLVQAGKDGNIYLGDRANGLGGFHSGSNAVVQEVSGQLPGGMWGSPSYWNGNIYFGAAVDGATTTTDPIRAFSFNAGGSGLISTTPTSRTTRNFGFAGPTSSISAAGTSNGILWALDNFQWESTSCPGTTSACQVLYAYDATNLATLLYSSSQASGNRDLSGGAVKFTVPAVANGKVYVGGQKTLTVYGLLP